MKYIALDIGNVICYANLEPFVKEVSTTFNISMDEASRWLRGFQQIHDLGLTTMEQQLRKDFGCRSEPTIEKLSQFWSNQIHASVDMVNFLTELHFDHDTKIALLSNIGVEHAAQMSWKLHPVMNFAIPHFSCEVGARKPTSLYYQSFLMQYPEFTGCLYLDDLHDNLKAASKLGFQSQHFELSPDVQDNILKIKDILLNTGEPKE